MDEDKLLERITVNTAIFGSKPIIRGRRLAVEHVLAILAAGDSAETICQGYPWHSATLPPYATAIRRRSSPSIRSECCGGGYPRKHWRS